jgi:hypothetical protein
MNLRVPLSAANFLTGLRTASQEGFCYKELVGSLELNNNMNKYNVFKERPVPWFFIRLSDFITL